MGLLVSGWMKFPYCPTCPCLSLGRGEESPKDGVVSPVIESAGRELRFEPTWADATV